MARRKKDDVLRTGEVTVEKGGKVYTARYELLRGDMVRLQSGQCTHLGRFTVEGLARTLLCEVVDGGHAEEQGIRVDPAT